VYIISAVRLSKSGTAASQSDGGRLCDDLDNTESSAPAIFPTMHLKFAALQYEL